MALADVRAAVTERLRLIPGILQAPDGPTPDLPEKRMLLVYPMPGNAEPGAHRGREGQIVVNNRDRMIVEWHLVAEQDQVAAFLDVGTPMIDTVRDAIWSEFQRNKFGGTVPMLFGVTTDRFGEMGWGGQFTWGFRLSMDLIHGGEVSAGRNP